MSLFFCSGVPGALMAHSRELSCEGRSLALSSLRSAFVVLPSATVTAPGPFRSYPTARIERAYLPGSMWLLGKLYFPCASLTTDTVKLAPSRRALTTTPSMTPSCCELTTPPRATGSVSCAMRSGGDQIIALITMLPRAMVRNSFDMGPTFSTRIDRRRFVRIQRPALPLDRLRGCVSSRDSSLHRASRQAVQAKTSRGLTAAVEARNDFTVQVHHLAFSVYAQAGARVVRSEEHTS